MSIAQVIESLYIAMRQALYFDSLFDVAVLFVLGSIFSAKLNLWLAKFSPNEERPK